MPKFFTSVNKHVAKKSGFISRMLVATPKNPETRAISTVEIRDTDTSKSQTMPAPVGGQAGKYYVYVILCKDNSLYIGQTNNLQARWEQHHQGKGALWTKTHAPVKIMHFEELGTLEEAVKREKSLKTGFGRKWLKKLVASNSGVDIRLPAPRQDEIATRQAGDMNPQTV